MRRGPLFLRMCVGGLLAVGISFAQVTTGTIYGTVNDSSGAVIPGATIVLRNLDTGISRTVVTDEAGRYRAPQLPLGNYEITAESTGFQTAVRTGITLTVGREAMVDFSLQIGAVAEKITVTGEAPMVETTNATVASLVNEKTMRDLPLNGRSFADLTAIQPGVVSNTGVSADVFTGGPRMSINGARAQQSLYLLDGTEIVAPYANVTPVSVMNQLLGVDTIREFSVLSNSYGAQYGRAIGGVINSVTRSGANDLHGSAFEFLRNDVLDARNFFDYTQSLAGHRLPPFRRNQFGATVGGPIVKDSTFYFLSYEGLRQRLGLTDFGSLINKEARETGILRDKDGKITQTVTVNPDILPLLNLMPLPNLNRAEVGGLGDFAGSRTEAGTEDYGMARIDRQLGQNDSLFGRLTIDESFKSVPSYLLIPGGIPKESDGAYRFAAISETRIISSTLLNTITLGFARNNVGEREVFDATKLDPRLSPVPGDPFLTAMFIGIALPQGTGQPGQNLNDPIRFTDNTFDVSDNMIYSIGRHSMNIGGTIKRYQMNELVSTWTHGFLFFSGVPGILTGKPFLNTSTLPGADIYRGYRQTYGALYVQDDFRILPNFTVNMGLRWERVSGPSEVNGKISILKDVLRDGTFTQPKKLFEPQDSLKGFAPRLGFAWTPTGPTTVIRGGFGIFKEIPLEYMYQLVMFVPPFAGRVTQTNPPFPFPLTGSITGQGEPLLIDSKFEVPYSYQYNLSLERQLSDTVVAKASYIGTRGLKFPALNNPNQPVPRKDSNGRWNTPGTGILPDPILAPTPNKNFTGLRYTSNIGNAYYNALQLSIEKRFSAGLQFNGSFTWSKNIDTVPIGLKCAEVLGGEVIFIIYNIYDLKADKALSSLDTRRNFILSYSYELPFGSGKPIGGGLTGIFDRLVSGWQLNGILTARDGLPQTALLTFANARSRPSTVHDRPDLLPGKSNNPTSGVTAGCTGVAAGQQLGGPDRYFDPCSFTVPLPGYFGNTARNSIITPGLFTWDFSLFKSNRIGENNNLEFRAEFFNMMNRANFDRSTSQVITSAAGTVNPTAGKIVSAKTSRQIQFGLKYTF